MIEERRGKTRECVVWTAIFLLSLQIYGSILTKTGFFWESYFVLYLLQTANNIERFLSLQVNGQQCEETTKNHCYHLPQQYAHKWVSLCESNKMKGPLIGFEKIRQSYMCINFILFDSNFVHCCLELRWLNIAIDHLFLVVKMYMYIICLLSGLK